MTECGLCRLAGELHVHVEHDRGRTLLPQTLGLPGGGLPLTQQLSQLILHCILYYFSEIKHLYYY